MTAAPSATPTCSCTPWHTQRGLYSPTCLAHNHYRCTVTGCMDVATEAHLCVIHGRHLRPLSPWGVGEDGEADRESSRYERDVLGL